MRLWWILILVACRRPAEPAHAIVAPALESAEPSPAPSGSLYAKRASFFFAVYHLSAKPPKDLARKLVAGAGFQLVEKVEAQKALATVLHPPLSEAPPPALESLRYRAHGLSAADQERLQHASSLTVMIFVAANDQLRSYRAALGAVRELAKRSDGVIYDAATRAAYSAEAFGELLEGWSGDVPDLRRHVTLDFYRDEELARIVSLGMEKFGLPDVAVANLSLGDSRSMGSLVNVVLQTLLERGALDRPGELDLSLPSLRSASLKKEMIDSLKKGGTGVGTVHLAIAKPDEGDAENRLLELRFPGPSGSLQIRHNQLLAKFFGAEDSLIPARENDEELLAASRRAKLAIARLKPRFSPKPPDLEHLLVKAPFTTPSGGTEWMWIEVVRWQGKKIQGILESDPYEVKDLKAGARVEADEDSLFDYILHHADGKNEGNETGKILEARQK